ncbi:MAG: AAA family ATPase [Candidatus Bathyarchaeia archaeon]
MSKVILAITGMPGAGKTTVANEVSKVLRCPIIRMGDVIREEAERQRLKLTDENLGKIMLGLRRRFGPEVVAKRCLNWLAEIDEPIVVVDGIRSYDEVKEFERSSRRVVLLSVFAPSRVRFERLYGRERTDDPQTKRSFRVREQRELSVGVGSAMAMADYTVLNDGDLADTLRSTRRIVESISPLL